MDTSPRFPWWIPAGALLLAAGYLPSLNTPFDFIDDGNLVYPSPPTSLAGHVELWWEKVRANAEHLGPFRPTLWAHWYVQANLLGGDPLAWRIYRLLWCGLAAGMLLWLFRELGVHPAAALLAGALAMWNPYRNEIWTSLTLAEGVAMPYALLGLVAARKAALSDRPLRWEVVSALGVLVALGCKNVFAALVPAQVALRMWPEGLTLREAWRRNGWRSLALAATLLLPAAHFAYFRTHWHQGQYETHAPTLARLGELLNSLKGAVSLDFMAAGVGLAFVCLRINRRRATQSPPTAVGGLASPLLSAALLLAAGVALYLLLTITAGRYTMPAVWGLDILFALLLTALVRAPECAWKKAAWVGVCGGLAAVMLANVGRQEKFAARARVLWDAVHYVEATAPPGARVAWVSGDPAAGGLGVEEGIHFRWHLYHRGRPDVTIGLFDADGRPLERVELPPSDGPPDYRLCGTPAGAWEPERQFAAGYWLGRRRYDCHLSRRPAPGLVTGAALREQMKAQLLAGLGEDSR